MKIIKYFLQFVFIIILFSLFKILGLNISSAIGGKLLGAGGGGFMLFYIKDRKKKDFLKKNNKLLNIPFNFSDEGSEVIFNHTK